MLFVSHSTNIFEIGQLNGGSKYSNVALPVMLSKFVGVGVGLAVCDGVGVGEVLNKLKFNPTV